MIDTPIAARARLAGALVTSIGAALSLMTSAYAQGEAADYGEGFVPASDVELETINGGNLMLMAYAAMWAAVFVYLMVLARRDARVRSELGETALLRRDLEARVEDLEGLSS